MYLSRRASIRIVVGILALFGVVVGWTILSRGSTSRPTVAISLDPEAGPKVTLGAFDRKEVRAGKVVWHLQADQGVLLPGKEEATLSMVTLDLFQGRSPVRVKAEQADVRFTGGEINTATLTGNVYMEYGDTLTVRSDDALFAGDSQQLSVKGPVTMITKNVEITGRGLSGDLATQRFVVLSKVRSTLTGLALFSEEPI